ncbi:restriction endonuclease [Brevibacillus panacihumi]|uniref:restriction endonuclease n=1 Tax=Brevibacillus panacihumi TaxID=497735 RepID=UPI003D1D3D5B
MSKKRSDIPMASEFSPEQVNLKEVLEIANACNGDKVKFDNVIHTKVFPKSTFKTSQNCRLSMTRYLIIDDTTKLTAFGQSLFDVRNDEKELYSRLAKHILENLNGYILVNTVREMQKGKEKITLPTVAKKLREKGIHVKDTATHHGKMRQWLEKANIFSGWDINEVELENLTGTTKEDLEALKDLTKKQRAFIHSLWVLGSGEAKDIAMHASMTKQIEFNEKALSTEIVTPLEKKGFISVTKKASRSTFITPTALMEKEIMLPLLESLLKEVSSDLHRFLEKPLDEVLQDVDSTDTHIKGLALEALAIRLMNSINLKYVETRMRNATTGGAEVDLIFESNAAQQLFFSRWQVQCKNTKNVSLEDVAKEVGLTFHLKSNVIVIITTGKIGQAARDYSKGVMANSNLVLILIDGSDLQKLKNDLGFMRYILERETRTASSIKDLDNSI